ncbi:MAG: helix-turn-helix domain-containing protein [Pseudomonadota bacterium]
MPTDTNQGAIHPTGLMTTPQAAAYLGLGASTLNRARVEGWGPEYVKLGAHAVRYERAALDAFVAAGRRRSTSGGAV